MLTQIFQSLGNRVLSLDPDILARLESVRGKCMQIDVHGIPGKWYLLITETGLQLERNWEGEVDVRLAGGPFSLMRLAVNGYDPSMFHDGSLSLEGNVSFAESLARILADLNIDWEELLARRLGDIPAHQIGRFLRSGRRWSKQAGQTVARDLSEFLQEEKRILSPRVSTDRFMREVDILRADVDRFELRVHRLMDLARPGAP